MTGLFTAVAAVSLRSCFSMRAVALSSDTVSGDLTCRSSGAECIASSSSLCEDEPTCFASCAFNEKLSSRSRLRLAAAAALRANSGSVEVLHILIAGSSTTGSLSFLSLPSSPLSFLSLSFLSMSFLSLSFLSISCVVVQRTFFQLEKCRVEELEKAVHTCMYRTGSRLVARQGILHIPALAVVTRAHNH
ncbi:hypothetical protein GE09DRAFT_343020 [Coniochaeta sp. 2T2.1]|nr:hypothetical protein GE09DRAFT_343020 [Coniochaeta sp. 2T2.1]